MNSAEVKRKLSGFDTTIGRLQAELAEAKRCEATRKRLSELARDSAASVAELEQLNEDLRVLDTVVGKEELEFKRRRLGFLESSITDQLEFIFPRKQLRAKINCNFDRRKMKLRLEIVDADGNARPPAKTEGKLSQQLISATAAYGCAKLLGKNILYMDEPFSCSSEDNLVKLQTLLSRFVAEGFQVILVSQSPMLFADIERRVISLRSSDGKQVDRVEYQDVGHLGE